MSLLALALLGAGALLLASGAAPPHLDAAVLACFVGSALCGAHAAWRRPPGPTAARRAGFVAAVLGVAGSALWLLLQRHARGI